jgi:hypothetical protein
MKLINPRIPAKKKEKLNKEVNQAESYPYGLLLRLESDLMDKLPISGDVQIEEIIHIQAKGFVRSISMDSKIVDGKKKKDHFIEIQITDIGIKRDDAESAFNEKEED